MVAGFPANTLVSIWRLSCLEDSGLQQLVEAVRIFPGVRARYKARIKITYIRKGG